MVVKSSRDIVNCWKFGRKTSVFEIGCSIGLNWVRWGEVTVLIIIPFANFECFASFDIFKRIIFIWTSKEI